MAGSPACRLVAGGGGRHRWWLHRLGLRPSALITVLTVAPFVLFAAGVSPPRVGDLALMLAFLRCTPIVEWQLGPLSISPYGLGTAIGVSRRRPAAAVDHPPRLR